MQQEILLLEDDDSLNHSVRLRRPFYFFANFHPP